MLLSLLPIAALSASLAHASATATYDPVEMLCLVNQQRVQNGARPLGLNQDLTNAAIYHSQDQANMHTMTHSDSKGRSLGDRITASGYTQWTSVGENVAYGYPSEQSCMTAWMNSPGHRANILNPQFTHFGSAVRSSDGTPYYTQDFGGDGHTYNFPVCPNGNDADAGGQDSQNYDTSNGEMNDGKVHIASVPSSRSQQQQQQPQMMMMSAPPRSITTGSQNNNRQMDYTVTYTTYTTDNSNNSGGGYSPNEDGGELSTGQLADSQNQAPSYNNGDDCPEDQQNGGEIFG